jgi:hypothetical protein
MDMEELAQKLAVLCEKHNHLEGVVIEEKRRLNHNLERIGNRLDDQIALLNSYRLEARNSAAGKPTWGVAVAIGALVSLCTGLAVLLLTH